MAPWQSRTSDSPIVIQWTLACACVRTKKCIVGWTCVRDIFVVIVRWTSLNVSINYRWWSWTIWNWLIISRIQLILSTSWDRYIGPFGWIYNHEVSCKKHVQAFQKFMSNQRSNLVANIQIGAINLIAIFLTNLKEWKRKTKKQSAITL